MFRNHGWLVRKSAAVWEEKECGVYKKEKKKGWENFMAIQKNSAFMAFILPSALLAAG